MALGVGQEGDPFGGGAEGDAVAGQTRADAERDRRMRLAGAGRAEQDDVLAARKSSWPGADIAVDPLIGMAAGVTQLLLRSRWDPLSGRRLTTATTRPTGLSHL